MPEHGVRDIVYSSPFIPPEWIAAHGFNPVRLEPAAEDHNGVVPNSEGVCPYMRMFANEAIQQPSAAGLVLASTCDQMRRCADILIEREKQPVFLVNIPATWNHVEVHRLYRTELERLGRFLERLGGRKPSNNGLVEIMSAHDQRRMAGKMPEKIKGGVPIALFGGPVARRDLALLKVVENAGGAIVLDGSESGERGLPAPFNRRRMKEDPLGELADAYFGSIPDVFQRPNSRLYEWLQKKIAEREVRGVILFRYVWCDLWHAEAGRLKERIDQPVLDIDLDGEDPVARNKTRIEAFLEGLKRSDSEKSQ